MDKQVTIRMPKELLAKWLAALRSGEYEQTKHHLRDSSGFCCLGVLQVCADGDVERHEGGSPLSDPTRDWLDQHGIEFRTSAGGLSFEPFLPQFQATATHCNDSMGAKFTDIADAIEACAEGV